jgi:hypothetical protein
MDERTDTADSRTGESDVDRSPRAASSTPSLLLTVVQYETRPDRGTVHPPGLTGIDRMETWLSADAAAFVDLDTWR